MLREVKLRIFPRPGPLYIAEGIINQSFKQAHTSKKIWLLPSYIGKSWEVAYLIEMVPSKALFLLQS